MSQWDYVSVAIRKGDLAERYLTKLKDTNGGTWDDTIVSLIRLVDPELVFLDELPAPPHADRH